MDNAIERAVMMCDGHQIRPQDLPPDVVGGSQPLPDTDELRSALRHYEKLHIIRVLRQWPDKREAARRLAGAVEPVSEDRGAGNRPMKPRDSHPWVSSRQETQGSLSLGFW